MSDFSQDIQNFQRYGTYVLKFDNAGNLLFDSSSINFNQVYLSLPLRNSVYKTSTVEAMYNVEFEEFIPQILEENIQNTDNLQEQLDIIKQENITLKSQIDSVIANSDSNSSAADQEAIKQVILELRKAIGQGRVDSDFSDTFPYTPIRKPII
jgi:hypothetical protein